MLGEVKKNWSQILPYLFMVIAAFSRWPGLFPPNFSALYGLAFCAGAFFAPRMRWWLPFATIVVSDIFLDLYYLHRGFQVFDIPYLRYQLVNYVAFAVVILLGKTIGRRASFLSLLGGGLLGALLFYFITNTASWLFNPWGNPEYTKTLLGWIRALTIGTDGWPQTWEFLRNTLLSGGIFTALFAGAMKLTASEESPLEKEPQMAPAPDPEAELEPATDETPA